LNHGIALIPGALGFSHHGTYAYFDDRFVAALAGGLQLLTDAAEKSKREAATTVTGMTTNQGLRTRSMAKCNCRQWDFVIDAGHEVLEDRYERSSTVMTSQLPTKIWHSAIREATIVADAICDRVVHNAHIVTLRGGSMRKRKTIVAEVTETKN
jgi:hypothetical protein